MLPKIGEITFTLAARGVAMIGPLVVSVITARALGPADRGVYFLVMSYAQIAAQVANLGLHSSNTYLGANRPELVGRLLVNSMYIAVLVAPVVALAIALLLGWPEALGMPFLATSSTGPVALMAVLLAPLMVAQLYVSNLAVGIGKVLLFNALTIGYSVLVVVLSGAVWVAKGGAVWFLFASAGAVAIICLIGAVRLLRGCLPLAWAFDRVLFREGVAFAFKAYLSTMFGFLMLRVGILALQQNASLEEVGLFSIAVQLTDGLGQLPATIGILLFPMMIRTEVTQRRTSMWRAFWGLGATMFVILVVGAIASQWLIPLLFGEAFEKSLPLTLAMFPQLLVLSFITVVSQFLAAQGYPWRQVWAWIIGFVIQAILSYWLTGLWAGFGVAVSQTISLGVVLAVLLREVFVTKGAMNTANGD